MNGLAGSAHSLTDGRVMELLEDPDRQALMALVSAADTLSAIEFARSALADWLRRNPDDLGALDAGEELALMEDALRLAEQHGGDVSVPPSAA